MEEQVEKMAKDFCRISCVAQKEKTNCDRLCEIYIFASNAYNAGYRNANDVRKETAKEILNAVDDESNGQTISVTNVLRKKYGVEVEE